MKLWVDDMRDKPDDTWVRAQTFFEATLWLYAGGVGLLSLDHDLGEDSGSGYDIAKWIVETDSWPDVICVHSMNPVGRENILALLERYAPESTTVYR